LRRQATDDYQRCRLHAGAARAASRLARVLRPGWRNGGGLASQADGPRGCRQHDGLRLALSLARGRAGCQSPQPLCLQHAGAVATAEEGQCIGGGMKTPYEVLGVPRNATDEAIRMAFRRSVKACHPDHNVGDAAAEEQLRQIIAAYEMLKTPDQRAVYD